MNKRKLVERALQRLKVVAHDEPADAHSYAIGEEALVQILADLNGPWGGITLPFTIAQDIPAAYQDALIDLLAWRVSDMFDATPPVNEITALMKVRAVANPYVRDMDLDDDDEVTEDEEEAFDRGAYF